MGLTKRLGAIIGLAAAGLVAFSATTIAFDLRPLAGASILGQPTGLLAAGVYHNSNVNAGFFSCCGSDGGTQIDLGVTHLQSTANPSVGPSTSTNEVDVNFSVSDFFTGTFISGCFIADRVSDFTVNQMLSFAQLNTTVLATTQTCGGQPFVGVTAPFNITATFSMSASVGQSTSVATYACGGYSATTQTKSSGSSNGSATFAATFLGGPVLPVFGADLFSFDQTIHAQGAAADGCISLGGKGAGPGPQSPGDYTSSSMSASMSAQPDDGSQPFSISVSSFTNTAHPVGRPISTQTETDVNVFEFDFYQFIRDCWVIAPSDFSIASDLHTASLNVPVTETVGQCQGASNVGPSVQGITATWTPTSPLANFSINSQGCHVSGTSAQTAATAHAVGSWPGTASSIDDVNAFLQTNSSTTHVTPGGC
jgi:hypothetical protein